MKVTVDEVKGAFGRLKKQLTGGGGKPRKDRRVSKRAELRIPIQVKIGASDPMGTRLHDISPSGLSFMGRSGVVGDPVWIRFEGYPGVCESFVLAANVARLPEGEPARMAVQLDRAKSRPQALAEYRKLVLHYLRHRPLLDDKENAFVEVRCTTCGWVGRVSARNRVCSRCGLRVKVLIT